MKKTIIKKNYALYLILILLTLVHATEADGVQDITPQISITIAPLVAHPGNQTLTGVVTIRNTSTSTLNSPLYLVVELPTGVTITGAFDLSPDQKPMLKLPLPQKGLLPGGTIPNFVVTFVNPKNVKFTPNLKVMNYAGSLPPDPGEAGKKTLAGIDANQNGIRDDVEIYIRVNFGKSEKEVQALNQMAISTQMGILTTTQNQSIKAANADSRALECLRYVAHGSKAWKSLEATFLNTPARLQAWDEHETRLSGQVFSGSTDIKASCTFDPDLLKN